MSYVVKGRKPKKHKMLAAVRERIASIDTQIEELMDAADSLRRFLVTLNGPDGIEEAGKWYCENEEELICVLPREVIRYYNPHTN